MERFKKNHRYSYMTYQKSRTISQQQHRRQDLRKGHSKSNEILLHHVDIVRSQLLFREEFLSQTARIGFEKRGETAKYLLVILFLSLEHLAPL